jgi:hypothetical protein
VLQAPQAIARKEAAQGEPVHLHSEALADEAQHLGHRAPRVLSQVFGHWPYLLFAQLGRRVAAPRLLQLLPEFLGSHPSPLAHRSVGGAHYCANNGRAQPQAAVRQQVGHHAPQRRHRAHEAQEHQRRQHRPLLQVVQLRKLHSAGSGPLLKALLSLGLTQGRRTLHRPPLLHGADLYSLTK